MGVKPEHGILKKIGAIRTGGVFAQNLFKKRVDFFLVLLAVHDSIAVRARKMMNTDFFINSPSSRNKLKRRFVPSREDKSRYQILTHFGKFMMMSQQ